MVDMKNKKPGQHYSKRELMSRGWTKYMIIHNLSTRGNCCRKCGRHIPLDSGYRICEQCYQRIRTERKLEEEFT